MQEELDDIAGGRGDDPKNRLVELARDFEELGETPRGDAEKWILAGLMAVACVGQPLFGVPLAIIMGGEVGDKVLRLLRSGHRPSGPAALEAVEAVEAVEDPRTFANDPAAIEAAEAAIKSMPELAEGD